MVKINSVRYPVDTFPVSVNLLGKGLFPCTWIVQAVLIFKVFIKHITGFARIIWYLVK